MTGLSTEDYQHLTRAVRIAYEGVAEGGYAIGAVLVKGGQVIGESANRNVQSDDATAHAEIECLRTAPAEEIPGATLYTTLSPCIMCAGAIAWLDIKRVVIGDSTSFTGNEDWLRSKGIIVIEAHDRASISLMKDHSIFPGES